MAKQSKMSLNTQKFGLKNHLFNSVLLNLFQRPLSYFSIIFLLILVLNGSVLAQTFGGGTGTEADPYKIYTKAHCEELADAVNNGIN